MIPTLKELAEEGWRGLTQATINRWVPRKDEQTEGQVRAIAEELGYLALAITISGAYVSQTPKLSSDLSAYLEEYRRRRQILAEQPDKLIDQA